jgi:tripartite-type tricarboxylate transporter receptor subunit TctC
MQRLLCAVVAVAAAMFNTALRADSYPSKPITIITAFGPGSASDTIARVLDLKIVL